MKLTTAIGSALLAALTLGASAKNIGTLTLGYKNGTVVQIPVVDEPWCNKITDDTSIVQYVQLDADYDSTGDQEITCYLPEYVSSFLLAT
ncbi:uncharacterized protein BDV14DRAFT_196266 [Aspergillus stella-maris]|uniref:uncharacterized protein n=1 Tax=Aspergillus stella-maris TaxID=1810926 RepID=UPI003CCE0AB6